MKSTGPRANAPTSCSAGGRIACLVAGSLAVAKFRSFWCAPEGAVFAACTATSPVRT
jgi:hypothetical protein